MQDLNEFGRFVKNLQNLQLDKKRLAIHIDLLQSITSVSSRRAFLSQWQSEQAMIERGQTDYDMLENAIAEEVPLLKLLRMLCLQSLCCGGFKKFDQFRREILQTYGYEYVFTLDNLESNEQREIDVTFQEFWVKAHEQDDQVWAILRGSLYRLELDLAAETTDLQPGIEFLKDRYNLCHLFTFSSF